MPSPRRLVATLFVAGLLAPTLPLLAAQPAEACMAAPMVRPGILDHPGRIDQAGEKVLFIQDGDEIAAHVQVQYYGDAKAFSWIVPIQALPTVGVGANEIFDALRATTQPTFSLTYRTEGTCKTPPPSSGAAAKRAPSAGAAAGAPAPAAGVTVVSQKAVGPYDATVLKAEDSGSLRQWFEANDYEVPAKLDASMAAYVAGKYYFVALKLQKDRESGDIQPVVLRYKADKPGLPIRLASLSAVPDMDLYVWVLGAQRAVPANYNHVEINEARIDWLNGGANYRQVVTEAMNEGGGRAFVTDYAGPASTVAVPELIRRRAELSTIELAGATDAPRFMAAVRQQPFFNDDGRLVAFFKRHVARPTPDSLVPVDDFTFYMGVTPGGGYEHALDGVKVDVAKAMQELQDSSIQPARAIVKAFAEKPYLTQLYTTMSPDEMVEDPAFVFNADMEPVPAAHRAEAITVCTGDVFEADAPIKIKLANGLSFYAKGKGDTGDAPSESALKPLKIPAAHRVMRCGTTGRPTSVTDNGNAISKLLNDLSTKGIALRINTSFTNNPREGAGVTVVLTVPFAEQLAKAAAAAAAVTSGAAGGFGCAGCSQSNTPPIKQGAGEGFTFALAFAGLLGYRRWLGRAKR